MQSQKQTLGIVIVITVILAALGASSLYSYKSSKNELEAVPEPIKFQDITEKETIPETPPTETKPIETQPDPKPTRTELNLDAPFYSQAPFGNWDFPWQEACEEASILLAANAYFDHNWTRAEFNDQILKMVDWQKERFGTYLDTTAAQTAEILQDHLGLESIIHEDPSYADVVKILNKGHFIIMFFAGKELGNPYFTNGGPNYHVLLVKGYKKGEKIITHDVGTKNGANYVYNWSTLHSAMHDFAVPIQSGAKRILEVLPPSSVE